MCSNKNVMGQKRNEIIDILRGLLAYFVILGHVILNGNIDRQVEDTSIFLKFIYSFHMPLFMMISSYLTGVSVLNRGNGYIIKKRLALCIPLILFAAVSSLLALVVNGFDSQLFFLDFLSKFLTGFWFCWAIIFITLLYGILSKLLGDKYCVAFIVIAIAGFFFTDAFNLAAYKFMLPFALIGFELAKRGICFTSVISSRTDSNSHTKIFWWRYVLLTGVFLICVLLYQPELFIHIGEYRVKDGNYCKQIVIDIIRIIVGCIGSLWVAITVQWLVDKTKDVRIWKGLAFLGKNSLELYMIHIYVVQYGIRLFATKMELHYSIILAFVQSTIVLMVTLLCISLLRKIQIYDYIFGRKVIWNQ